MSMFVRMYIYVIIVNVRYVTYACKHESVPVIFCYLRLRPASKFLTKLLPSLNKVLLTYLFTCLLAYTKRTF